MNHPEVDWIEKTGYPSFAQPKEEPIYCCECGKDITDKDKFEDSLNETLCEDCLLMLHRKREC